MSPYKNIMLVEDNEEEQVLFDTILARILPSASLAIAENGSKALDLLPVLPEAPDLIFVDLNMPVMDGLEFLSQVKTKEAYTSYKDIPVVMLTTSVAEPEKYYELGACLCISKPTSPNSYRNVLTTLLSSDIEKDKVKYRTLLARLD